MPFALQLFFIFVQLYSMYEARKTDKEKIESTDLDTDNIPTVDETTPIQIIHGTVQLNSSMITWYGENSNFPIYQKVSDGGFFGLFENKSKTQVGFGYNLAIQYGLGWGGENATMNLRRIKISDEVIYENNVNGSYSDKIDNKEFFGPYVNGAGGISGNFTFYDGSPQQIQDPYMLNILGEFTPHRNNKSYFVWKGGYIGNSNNLTNWSFTLNRHVYHQNLNSNYVQIKQSTNPVNVIYDYLTNDIYGLSFPPELIDISNFDDSARIIFNEGVGISMLVNQSKEAETIINDLLNVVNAQFKIDFSTYKVQLKLIRDDYNVNDLLYLNDDNIIEIDNMTRGTTDNLVTEVKVKFTNIERDFKSEYASAKNPSARFSGSNPDVVIIDYSLINYRDIAEMIAQRELLPRSVPLFKCDVTTTRIAANITPGDVILLNYKDFGIVKTAMRVLEVNYKSFESQEIELKLVQDVFGVIKYTELTSNNNRFVDTDYTAKAADLKIEEAPYYFSTNDTQNKVITFAKKPTSVHVNYDLYTKLSDENNYILNSTSSGFTPVGILKNSIDENAKSIILTNESNLSLLQNQTSDNLTYGYNMALIIENDKKEFINFQNFTVSSNTYTLSNVNRALLDTIPQSFTNQAKIYFFSYGYAINQNQSYSNNSDIRIKAVTRTSKKDMLLNDAPTIAYLFTNRKDKPIAPANLKINNKEYSPFISTAKENLKISFSNRDKIRNSIQYYDTVNNSNNDNNYFNIKIYDNSSGNILKNITTQDQYYEFIDEINDTNTSYYNQLKIEINTINNNVESIYKYVIIVNRV